MEALEIRFAFQSGAEQASPVGEIQDTDTAAASSDRLACRDCVGVVCCDVVVGGLRGVLIQHMLTFTTTY